MVKLYIGLYWSDYLPIPNIFRSRVGDRDLEDLRTENRQPSCKSSFSCHGTQTHTPQCGGYFVEREGDPPSPLISIFCPVLPSLARTSVRIFESIHFTIIKTTHKKRAEAENIKKLGDSGVVNTYILNRAMQKLELYRHQNRLLPMVFNATFCLVQYLGRG